MVTILNLYFTTNNVVTALTVVDIRLDRSHICTFFNIPLTWCLCCVCLVFFRHIFARNSAVCFKLTAKHFFFPFSPYIAREKSLDFDPAVALFHKRAEPHTQELGGLRYLIEAMNKALKKVKHLSTWATCKTKNAKEKKKHSEKKEYRQAQDL